MQLDYKTLCKVRYNSETGSFYRFEEDSNGKRIRNLIYVESCICCGEPYFYRIGNINRGFCSNDCKSKEEFNPNWRGGITPLRRALMNKKRYRDWRTSIYERDKYTCVLCGQTGVRLNAHHIIPFMENPLFRYERWNGVTLCQSPCHSSITGREHEFINSFTSYTCRFEEETIG